MPKQDGTPQRDRKTILIVEDDRALRRIFSDALKFAGFDVCEVSDGPIALQLMEYDPPDLVVLDIGLPTLDGISVREEIAAHAGTRDIPIIVVTGAAVDAERLAAQYVLRKPISAPELVAAVRSCFATS